MSEINGPNSEDKRSRIRRLPKPDSVLTPTFAASWRNTSDNLWDDRGQQESGLLQRQCACGVHTIAGGECDGCRQKRESNFLQRTTVNSVHNNASTLDLVPTEQPLPSSYAVRDFSQIPISTAQSKPESAVQAKSTIGATKNSVTHQSKLIEQEADVRGGLALNTGFMQAYLRGGAEPVRSVSSGTVSRQVIQRKGPTYQSYIKGSASQKADTAGNVAAAGATENILPTIQVPLDHAASRQGFFRQKMVEHLNRGMRGYYGDLKETWAYQSMKTQLDGYIKDIPAMTAAASTYNSFVPNANLATRGMHKHTALQDSLGFDDETDFDKQLTGTQKEALKTAIHDNPALLLTDSVVAKQEKLDGARTTLHGHLLGYSAIITGKAMKEVQGTITKNEKEQEEINKKIAKVAKIAGYVQKAATYAAAGAGALAKAGASASAAASEASAAEMVKKGAGHVKKGAGHLATAVTVAMQLYYAKELKDFESKINQAKDELNSLKASKSASELASKLKKLEGAKKTYKSAVNEYDEAIQKRRVAMAALASKADEKLVGKKGQAGGQDFVGQVLLYMTSVRENRSLVGNGMTAGSEAKGEISKAMTQLRHRSKSYQTNAEAHGTVRRVEGDRGPDAQAIYEMNRKTFDWLGKAKEDKDLLDKQEKSAAKVMAAAGQVGKY